MATPPEKPEFRQNHRASIGAVIFLTFLLVIGLWIVNRLDASQKAQACLESGGRRCAQIDTEPAR